MHWPSVEWDTNRRSRNTAYFHAIQIKTRNSFIALSAHLRIRGGDAPWSNFFNFHAVFRKMWPNNWLVGCRLPPPTFGKSWIRLWSRLQRVRLQQVPLSKLADFVAWKSLVSTYVVCDRLSVMQRHTESGKANFVLKILRTPCSGIWLNFHHWTNSTKMTSWRCLMYWPIKLWRRKMTSLVNKSADWTPNYHKILIFSPPNL